MTKRALHLMTSHASLSNTGRGTGFYYDEMEAPFRPIRDQSGDVTLALVAGGAKLPDPKILVEPDKRPPNIARFMDDTPEMDALQTTAKAAEIKGTDYNYNLLPGGYGAMWDFDIKPIDDIVTEAWAAGEILDAVCHGPAGLLQAKDINDDPLVCNKRFNSFTNRETEQIELIRVEPFLVETRLRDARALFECSDNLKSHAVKDGRLNHRGNPQSTETICRLLKESLEES